MNEQTRQATIGHTTDESTPYWPQPASAPAGAPNVIYIVFDDMGFADLGCYGSEIATPHIDAMAAGGLRYTNFHTTALCSPTRAALLTGRNHHSVGIWVFQACAGVFRAAPALWPKCCERRATTPLPPANGI